MWQNPDKGSEVMSGEPSGACRQQGTQVVYQVCPECGNQKWKVYMNPDTGAWICFRCDARGKAKVDITATSLLDKLKPRVQHEWPEVRLPEWTKLSRTGRKYLRDRGIHRPEDFGIVELKDSTRVLIPYRGPQGKVIYWATRSFIDDGLPKYVTATGRKPLYVLPDWTAGRPTVLVEGVVDAIVHYIATGISTIALGGKSVARYNRASVNSLAGEDAVVMLDSDATAQAVKIAREFNMKLKLLPPGMDPAEYYLKEIESE